MLFAWPIIRSMCSLLVSNISDASKYEARHDKTKKMSVRPAKTQISLGIRPVWSESSLSAWRKHGYLATQWAHIEDSDQTGRMPRLIWVFAGRTLILLVLSCRGSYMQIYSRMQICPCESSLKLFFTCAHLHMWVSCMQLLVTWTLSFSI